MKTGYVILLILAVIVAAPGLDCRSNPNHLHSPP